MVTMIESLFTDIEHLAAQGRPPHSDAEAAAIQWIEARLTALGLETQQQPFMSTGLLLERWGPVSFLAGLATLIAMSKSERRRGFATMLVTAALLGSKQVHDGQPAFWETYWPQRSATNVVGVIPAQVRPQHRVVLVAHVDSDRARLSAHPRVRQWLTGHQNIALMSVAGPPRLRKLVFAAITGQLALLIADEAAPSVAGAIDNASGIALLLHLAEHLSANPLPYTEVALAFTSCDTLNGRGSAELVSHYGDVWQDAHWLVVDSIGAGELCWITPNIETKAAPLLEQVARDNRAFGVMGRTLSIADPAIPLRAGHVDAVALMGYERSDHFPVHWRRTTDTIDQIDPTSLERAWHFVWATLQAIEAMA